MHDFSLRINKEHVQRNQRVFHPHLCGCGLGELEQHTVIRLDAGAIHQALGALLGRLGDLEFQWQELTWNIGADAVISFSEFKRMRLVCKQSEQNS